MWWAHARGGGGGIKGKETLSLSLSCLSLFARSFSILLLLLRSIEWCETLKLDSTPHFCRSFGWMLSSALVVYVSRSRHRSTAHSTGTHSDDLTKDEAKEKRKKRREESLFFALVFIFFCLFVFFFPFLFAPSVRAFACWSVALAKSGSNSQKEFSRKEQKKRWNQSDVILLLLPPFFFEAKFRWRRPSHLVIVIFLPSLSFFLLHSACHFSNKYRFLDPSTFIPGYPTWF